ncbi:hypothetical protein [Halalkalibacter okhensis]|uniref:Uncharacterized protein n=1 Tax=Halalkalibacter okhensis TaxID=333138 RepID=A0A0B0IKT5_9BACI|nr:hypothetical protein [Halalkalibacter okhensis]KHF41870.1 hypothetical protein LQ50_00830 [Halalkalibacter okhensis]
MDENRKKIIINEIRHWKSTKLLPENYCDFLLTLYTEGEHELKESSKKKSLSVTKFTLLTFIMVQLLFLLTILVIYFTDFSLAMQITVVVPFIAAILLVASKSSHALISSYYFMITALIFYLLTVEIVMAAVGHSAYLIHLSIIHCIVWLFVGWWYSLRIFVIAGAIGFLVSIFFLF